MRLVITLPNRVELSAAIDAVRAEGVHGTFAMLPRHLDFVVLLVPGILTCRLESGGRRHVAVDGGVLVKVGDEVRVATETAVSGERLEELERTVVEDFRRRDRRDRDTRAALARIESHLIQESLEFEEGE